MQSTAGLLSATSATLRTLEASMVVGLLLIGSLGGSAPGAVSGEIPTAAQPNNTLERFSGFKPSRWFRERTAWLNLEAGVRVLVNAPAPDPSGADKKLLLIFYALPNGNTIEQTVGKVVKPGDDWHFGIQHIGAQTRFLRNLLPERTVVVAYLENGLKSWPAWRKKFGDKPIPEILETVKSTLPEGNPEIVLSGHSGGGSLIFGYLNAMERLPPEVVRIAFLDANYAYEALLHKAKLVSWLTESPQHFLCVLAYDDASALLEGKTFVSPKGGTWGKSHEMQADLSQQFAFNCQTNSGFERFLALGGRVQFLLKENPDRKILHTILVERNGFIHSVVCGTSNENRGYVYFTEGAETYSRWIQPE